MPNQHPLFDALARVRTALASPLLPHPYLSQPIPSSLDDNLSHFTELFTEAPPDERAAILRVDDWQTRELQALLTFGRRMATQAVRVNADRPLLLGLVALLIEGWRYDYRENIITMVLIFDAALRTNIDPTTLFHTAASYSPGENLRQRMLAVLQRTPEDNMPAAVGYLTDSGGSEFTYKMDPSVWGV